MRSSSWRPVHLWEQVRRELERSFVEDGLRIERERRLLAEPMLRGVFAFDSGVIIEMLLGTLNCVKVVESFIT